MADFGTETWVMLGSIAAAAVFAMFYVLALFLERERAVTELKAKVHRLHRERAMVVAEMDPDQSLPADMAQTAHPAPAAKAA